MIGHRKEMEAVPEKKYAYSFRLKDGKKGTFLTDVHSLEYTRCCLQDRYGDQLVLVTEK